MASAYQDPATLLRTLLSVIETRIVPLTAEGVRSGSKVFGAAILSKSDLAPLTVATNDEKASPLLHGEINCIQKFFTSPPPSPQAEEARPSTRDCVFLATHEPCSLCLSGITWSGFDNFYYLFTYADSRDLFAIPYDIQILEAVFRVPAVLAGESAEDLESRELYNRRNKFFTSKSFADLLDEIADAGERARLAQEIERVKALYNGLSATYQEGKQGGHETASVWQ
ncbi:cytidine deoxycytidylate deaminase family protein [Xylariales sp. PMI_506]|nr:cytidine deoxycytidylate deaminase family protein [Xylariales sp. PMI_506]